MVAAWYFMYRHIYNTTCILGNHEFENRGKTSICKKCGLMKRNALK